MPLAPVPPGAYVQVALPCRVSRLPVIRGNASTNSSVVTWWLLGISQPFSLPHPLFLIVGA